MLTVFSFIGFTALVAFISWYKLREENLSSREGYFLGGRSLTGTVIAGSLILTNISTEHLVGMNGSSYKNGFVIIAWEVTSALALVAAALYFVPRYLRMGLTTIPEYLEKRFDGVTRTIVASFLIVSFVVTLLPIVLFTGAINIESIFNLSEVLGVSKGQGLWLTVLAVGILGSVYAIFGGLKAVALSDTINGVGLLLAGLAVPTFALLEIGNGDVFNGLKLIFNEHPEKFNVIGSPSSVLPFEALFTGLVINQIYFWCMNQAIIQRALGARNLVEAQKGLLYAGGLKILVPLIIVLPGVIGYHYFGDSLYTDQDSVYPQLVKRVLPVAFWGFFAAVVMGAVLSTFNSVLNSAATIFSVGIYQRHINANSSEQQLVKVGKLFSAVLAVFAILIAPMVANAPEGLYQLLQQLNGIFFIPIASIILAGFFIPWITARAAKVSLFVGLSFYISTTFIFPWDLHFVHIWGIEFILNIAVMLSLSWRAKSLVSGSDQKEVVDLKPWRFANHWAIVLVVVTIGIYIWLGN